MRRSRIFVTSASTMHSLMNVLRYGHRGFWGPEIGGIKVWFIADDEFRMSYLMPTLAKKVHFEDSSYLSLFWTLHLFFFFSLKGLIGTSHPFNDPPTLDDLWTSHRFSILQVKGGSQQMEIVPLI